MVVRGKMVVVEREIEEVVVMEVLKWWWS